MARVERLRFVFYLFAGLCHCRSVLLCRCFLGGGRKFKKLRGGSNANSFKNLLGPQCLVTGERNKNSVYYESKSQALVVGHISQPDWPGGKALGKILDKKVNVVLNVHRNHKAY